MARPNLITSLHSGGLVPTKAKVRLRHQGGLRRESLKPSTSKWDFAIGTTSRVPGCPITAYGGLHYLILDIDKKEFPFHKLVGRKVIQETKSGWHIYTEQRYYFMTMLEIAEELGADRVWVGIARQRGYAFLADKSPLSIPWPVERMVIGK